MIEIKKALIKSFADLEASRIGILGGTFDPPHNGHLEVARVALSKYHLDYLVFVPAKKNPLKITSPIATDEQRIKMLELLLANEDRILISDLEILSQEPSFTVNTLREIKTAISPSCQIYLILGTDNLFDDSNRLSSLPYWRDKSEIFKLANLIFIARDQFKVEDLDQLDRRKYSEQEWEKIVTNIIPLNLPISATQIRREIYQSNFPKGILPDQLIEYIKENKIYLD